jgi:two-component sensor histidine kinase
MKGSPIFRKFIYSPWLLAVIPAILIIILLPPLGSKYMLIVEETGKFYSSDTYYDLNNDGITEVVSLGKGFPYYFVIVRDNNYRVYDQWNFKDDLYPDLSAVFFGNYDNDSYQEIYVFTCKGDSIFLNVNEFFDPKGLKIDRLFITKVGLVNNVITSVAYPACFFDVNGDGFRELYFSIATGFALEPRLLYYLDIEKKELKSSKFLGVNCQYTRSADIDEDTKPEIFGLMSASGNYKIKTPYSDMSTWFMVFDENLNFEFPPVEFPGLTNTLEINPYIKDNFRGYLLSHNTGSADSAVMKPKVMMFSSSGKLVRERWYIDYGFGSQTHLNVLEGNVSDRIYVMEKDLIELDHELEVINRVKSPFSSAYSDYAEDIDGDGQKEFILYSPTEEKLAVYNSALQMLAETNIKASNYLLKFSHFVSSEKKQKLFLSNNEYSCFLELKKNKSYYLGYMAYPVIYLMLVLFISMLNRINSMQVKQKENLKHRLLTLQLQGIKGQLDPHFTFNSLNSVASLIYLEERQAAYDYLNKFTRLLRGLLNDAERIYRTLGEELEFVTTYLELEKMRFGDRLNYNIEIGEGVTREEMVPKMVLHTFAENAIKHGLMQCENGGKLQISVFMETDYLKIVIEDNGIGREKAAGNSHSTGKGLKITGEFYDILNQLNKKPISHSITDLYDKSGKSSGTRVEVMVPVYNKQ